MITAYQPVRVATGSDDEDGCLVFVDERLAAVLVRLSDQHGAYAGRWFLEHGFGPLDRPTHPTFSSLDEAGDWIVRRMAASA